MQVHQEDLVESDGTTCLNEETGEKLGSSLVQLAQSVEADNFVFPVSSFKHVSESAMEKVVGAWLKPVSGYALSFERNVLKKAAVS